MKALGDRVFVNRVNLNSKQIKDKILSKKTYKPNMKIWAKIKEKLNKKKELSEQSTEMVYHLIEESDPTSVRDIWKLEKIASFSVALIGDLNLMDYFRETDDVWKIINQKIKRSQKVKKIAELKCITERGARKIVSKFEKGKV